ncbi:uncharacterized protein PHALS_06769 [Plasmopara halstedii]|uniref:Uncharacterized protein n=1 Tax=Plasmopara halstedii TaxID=4781 RepID=A0A0N7L861_PLAHL|nr:uncharacterized protein PHALS_06769 [Plasmopara halstedii]CEG48979.1 hypothetical protein PHALS_06769 [Plasmopara halstedii]|eukprot:XP_024585348.1 hypothetical protein PHALS_06769 [Plasmopara halstedii]
MIPFASVPAKVVWGDSQAVVDAIADQQQRASTTGVVNHVAEDTLSCLQASAPLI